jgi:hypothetical protein
MFEDHIVEHLIVIPMIVIVHNQWIWDWPQWCEMDIDEMKMNNPVDENSRKRKNEDVVWRMIRLTLLLNSELDDVESMIDGWDEAESV